MLLLLSPTFNILLPNPSESLLRRRVSELVRRVEELAMLTIKNGKKIEKKKAKKKAKKKKKANQMKCKL